MNYLWSLLFLLTSFTSIDAQLLTGKVTTTEGNAVPFATVYIHEAALGMVTNENGVFQTRLIPGTYTVETRFLGYENLIKTVEVPASGTFVQFKLAEKVQNLREVTISPSKENPAYEVMRHAIACAPYHLYQVTSYTSDNYLKGSAKIESVPTLMKMMIKDKKLKSMIGQLFVLESQNSITYKSPSYYIQRVLAYKSSIPKEMEPKGGGIRVVTSNIYAAKYDDCVSPLSLQAFQYYKFSLSDIFSNGKYQINKIHVTPKIRNAALFSGDIYIVDKDWSVFSLDLSVTEMGSTVHYKVNYQEIQPGTFLPITYNMYTTIGTMGVKGFAQFYSSVKYKNILLNPAAVKTETEHASVSSQVQKMTTKQKRTQETFEKLAVKEKLSTAEALKLAKLSNKILEPDEILQQHRNMEIIDTSSVKLQVDSLATGRDSIYWKSVRNVPLLADEALSFHRVDSLPPSKSIKTTGNSIEINLGDPSSKKNRWLTGGKIALGDSATLSYNGLLRGVLKEYNFADGVWLGQKLSLNLKTSKHSSLSITPWAYYATARKQVNWNTEVKYNYLPMSNGQFSLNVGSSSADIQGDNGTSRVLNSLSSLLTGDNVIRFFQSKAVKFENHIDLANGLIFTIGAGYESRRLLNNNTTFHMFGNTPYANVPDAEYIAAFPENTATTAWTKIAYTPFCRYRLINGGKMYAGSDYPTFTGAFYTAFRLSGKTEQAKYSLLKSGVEQQIKIDEWGFLKYYASFGTYLNSNHLYAPDYFYFKTNPLFVTFNALDNSFALLPNYSASFGNWDELHVKWQSDYLLLKRIGFMQRYIFNEALHLNILYENGSIPPYTEVGYSIGLGNLIRAGVFCSFNGVDFRRTGIRVSIPIFGGMK